MGIPVGNDIEPSDSPSSVGTMVDQFIEEAPDGSLRVNEGAMQAWLMEQFAAFEGDASGATPNSKTGEAYNIVQQLKAAVNREAWEGDPAFPHSAASGTESVTARLKSLQDKLADETHTQEAPYRDFEAGFTARAKVLFGEAVAPLIKIGIDLIEHTRMYVETFVTDRGEESAPSPASAIVTLDQNDTTTVTCSAPPAGRSITKRRLYRNATGSQTSAFKLQGEYDIAQTSVTDETLTERLNDTCATFGWLEPPATLQGLIGLPNGMMMGFVKRTLYACEPYHPYAYPAKYDKPLAHDIVGLVAVGQSAFVGTTGRPYLVSGSDAASLSEELISSRVPCLSARSMVAIGNAVFYASPDGLALYENGKVIIVTKGIIDRKTWRAYNPDTMRAGEFDGMYMAFYTKDDASKGCLVFDYESRALCELDQGADAVFSDEDGIYLLNGTAVYDGVPASGTLRTGAHHSKTFRLARPQAFAWIHVDSDFLNNGTPVSATVRVYADNVLHHTATISTGAPVRNKPGRFRDWRIEIECAAQINGVTLASTTDELKAAL